MPDISMCNSLTCKVRTHCYRNEASGTQPSEWRQSYMVFEPEKGWECSGFDPVILSPVVEEERLKILGSGDQGVP